MKFLVIILMTSLLAFSSLQAQVPDFRIREAEQLKNRNPDQLPECSSDSSTGYLSMRFKANSPFDAFVNMRYKTAYILVMAKIKHPVMTSRMISIPLTIFYLKNRQNVQVREFIAGTTLFEQLVFRYDQLEGAMVQLYFYDIAHSKAADFEKLINGIEKQMGAKRDREYRLAQITGMDVNQYQTLLEMSREIGRSSNLLGQPSNGTKAMCLKQHVFTVMPIIKGNGGKPGLSVSPSGMRIENSQSSVLSPEDLGLPTIVVECNLLTYARSNGLPSSYRVSASCSDIPLEDLENMREIIGRETGYLTEEQRVLEWDLMHIMQQYHEILSGEQVDCQEAVQDFQRYLQLLRAEGRDTCLSSHYYQVAEQLERCLRKLPCSR